MPMLKKLFSLLAAVFALASCSSNDGLDNPVDKLEAVMWHGSATYDARKSVENFRKLTKADRDAVIRFIDAI